jgi:uncharacterized integral membrane protein
MAAVRRTRMPTATPVWLYVLIVLILGATLIVGVVCWVWLTFDDKDIPDGLATLLATIAGGLVGALTMGEFGRSRSDVDSVEPPVPPAD